MLSMESMQRPPQRPPTQVAYFRESKYFIRGSDDLESPVIRAYCCALGSLRGKIDFPPMKPALSFGQTGTVQGTSCAAGFESLGFVKEFVSFALLR